MNKWVAPLTLFSTILSLPLSHSFLLSIYIDLSFLQPRLRARIKSEFIEQSLALEFLISLDFGTLIISVSL